jgi:hypothetical protein
MFLGPLVVHQFEPRAQNPRRPRFERHFGDADGDALTMDRAPQVRPVPFAAH